MKITKLHAAILAASLAGGMTASAAVSVTLNSVNPGEFVTVNGGSFDAGVYNLTINGVPTPSFCIDLAHGINLGQSFTGAFVGLATLPTPPNGPMGAAAALKIDGLVGTYFAGIAGSGDPNDEAAALQLAIWDTVAHGASPSTFNTAGTDADIIARMIFMEGNLTTFADLSGLVDVNADEHVQSFVVVPEPTTMIAGALLLLPFGASTLRVLRKNKQA
jgi:hypothetical protein